MRCASALLVIALASCTSIQPVRSPVEFLTRHNPDHVKVVAGGEIYVLSSPFLRRDTLFGFNEVEREEGRLAVASLEQMEARQLDRTRTTLLVGGVAALVTAGVVMISRSGDAEHFFCDSYEVQNRCPPRLSVFNLPLRR